MLLNSSTGTVKLDTNRHNLVKKNNLPLSCFSKVVSLEMSISVMSEMLCLASYRTDTMFSIYFENTRMSNMNP